MVLIMKVKLKPWEKWNVEAKKQKEKVLRQLCKNCNRPFSECGVSAYDGICKKCAES